MKRTKTVNQMIVAIDFDNTVLIIQLERNFPCASIRIFPNKYHIH